jgi:diketogulonate reductase-like aldo/keto reductase
VRLPVTDMVRCDNLIQSENFPKSTNLSRIGKNADIFGFTIDDEDMAAIEKMDRGDGVAWAMGDSTKAP